MLVIRTAKKEEAPAILSLLKDGIKRMQSDGNFAQWTQDTHSIDTVLADITQGISYLLLKNNTPIATFVLLPSPDPTYQTIDGAWLNDAPYFSIHRLASDVHHSGTATQVFNWALEQGRDLRADTHADNLRMQHLLLKHGFQYCGIIHLNDGSPRLAYQKLHPTTPQL